MLSQTQAKEKLADLLASTKASKAHYDAYFSLAMIYDHGPQWGYARRNAAGVGSIRRLRHVVDPNRRDLRVAMNMIHQHTTRIISGTSPQRIRANSLVRGKASGNIELANAYDALLQAHLRQIKGLKRARHANRNRGTLGTGIIRRTLAPKGKSSFLRKKGKKTLAWRTNAAGWESVFPWEILRDPVATTTDPGTDEAIYCHYKPRSVEWIMRHFGKDVETETTLGQLYSSQKQMQAATGWRLAPSLSQSKAKGVMVYEAYFRDEEMGEPWPHVMYAIGYAHNTTTEFEVVHFGRNQFYGLPFHHYVYDPLIQVPWGAGVPHLLMAGQDITNISFTWLIRIMQEGSGKWMIENGTVENPAKALNSRLDEPLIVQPRRTNWTMEPKRVAPPQINPAATQLLASTPQWMKDQLNLSDVQFGKSSKRGEAGKALEIKLDAAEVPLEDVRRGDELVHNELMMGTLVDVVKHYRLDQLRELLGGSIPDHQIRALKHEDPAKVLADVQVTPATLRPRTPTQITDEFIRMANAKIIDPQQAQWEMLLQGNIRVNTEMAEAYHKQMSEVAQMKAGIPVSIPKMGDEHVWHIKTCRHVINSQEYSAMSDEAQDALDDHLWGHMQAERDLMTFGQEPLEGNDMQSASPPAEAVSAAAGIAGQQIPAAINVA